MTKRAKQNAPDHHQGVVLRQQRQTEGEGEKLGLVAGGEGDKTEATYISPLEEDLFDDHLNGVGELSQNDQNVAQDHFLDVPAAYYRPARNQGQVQLGRAV